MASFKHIGNTIFIDDLQVPLKLFLALEPSYRVPEGMETLNYKDGTLRVRINGKTSTVSGWAAGDRYIARKKDFETIVKLSEREDNEISFEVDSMTRPEICRERDYPDVHHLIVALWEHIVEKKSTADSGIDDLQKRRVEVKNKYPLKETQNGPDQVKGSTETVLPPGTRRARNRGKHSG